MLAKTIVKHKPSVPATHAPWNYPNTSAIKNQQDLNQFLKETKILPGAYIRYHSNGPVVTSLQSISYVLALNHVFDDLEIAFNGQPCTHRIISVNAVLPNTHWPKTERNVNINDYVILEEGTLEAFIDDNVQNHIKKYLEEREFLRCEGC